ncbi:inosine-uridine preferring nucleoside hydrolase-like isoform X2 [Venturia canescens]|uniref:inosine-uridine preferring nucleoside hydrolase-like isoform X2 n=1 Tax=Venturia canescens TaxID=32260 RepID=UPI001C9C0F4D|nr:inosine-uridine preferring nucleoside hydrolase-like isoform X2 [Venturia canescens]
MSTEFFKFATHWTGVNAALLNTESARIIDADTYHGADGLGDVFTNKQDTSKLQTEHAVVALQKIVSENPGEISLVCMAPLTNVALAMKMYPDFGNSLKELYIMGGNYTGKGNITAQAEFNFFADPESAHIVLNSITEPLILLPWETCLASEIALEWRHEVLGKMDNAIVTFLNAIETHTYPKTKPSPYKPCDGLLAAIVIRPEIVKLEEKFHADIELHGGRTRGQVVLDHLQSRKPNVRIIMAYDAEIFKEILLLAVKQD